MVKSLDGITSKFGKLWQNQEGYYHIVSSEEGNQNKYFHRLIYEDFHKVCLLPDVIIHHKDGNPKNNCILNLEAMYNSEHSIKHRGIVKGDSYEDYLKKIEKKYHKSHT